MARHGSNGTRHSTFLFANELAALSQTQVHGLSTVETSAQR